MNTADPRAELRDLERRVLVRNVALVVFVLLASLGCFLAFLSSGEASLPERSILAFFMLVSAGGFIAPALVQSNTRLRLNGISTPTWLGAREISWEDVIRVDRLRDGFLLYPRDSSPIYLRSITFCDPGRLEMLLEKVIPAMRYPPPSERRVNPHGA
jgi:hypothetical protein